jgi:hypothetical protein
MTASIFDLQAAEWDNNPGRIVNARQIADAMLQAVPSGLPPPDATTS